MSDSKLTPPTHLSAMSLRECRLILERLLVAAGTHPGLVPAARDAAVAAEILGLEVMRALHTDPHLLVPQGALRLTVTHRPDAVHVDGGGALSLHVAPAVRDLLLETTRDVSIVVTGVREPGFLGGIALSPGLEAVTVRAEGERTVVAREAEPRAAALLRDRVATAIEHAQRTGLAADPDLWFALYTRSDAALAEDTPLSRRHAGHRDVDEHGRIVKPMDDDTDLELALQGTVAR